VISIADLAVHKNKAFLKVAFSFMVLFFLGMRFAAGVDWSVYLSLYNGNNINVPFEIGYKILNVIFSYSGLGFWSFVFFITLFSFLSLSKYFSIYSKYPLFCLALYYLLSFAFNVEALRQIIAVALVINALVFYLQGKLYYFYGAVLVGITMHASATLFLFFPLIDNAKFRSNALYLVMIGVALAVINQFPIDWIINLIAKNIYNPYIDKIKLYSSEAQPVSFFTINFMFKLFVLMCLMAAKKNIYASISSRYQLKLVGVTISLFYLMLFIDVYLGKYGTLKIRLNEYLNPAFVVMIVLIISNLKYKFLKQAFSVIVLLYATISFVKFMNDPYFKNQFIYHNSLLVYLSGDKGVLVSREDEVFEYWQNREKIIAGD